MKLLILSLDAYSIFYPDSGFIFGGAEVETGYHARGLAELGAEVSVVTRDHGTPGHLVENVRLVPHPEYKGAGYWNKRKTIGGRISFRLFGDRNSYASAEELFCAMSPDIAYVMGTVPEAKRLAAYCRKEQKHFVYRVAHDMDLGDGNLTDERMKKWAGMTVAETREIIETASLILVQTPLQQELLRKEFDREGVMMFPPISLDVPKETPQKKYDVLWIGKNNSFKRPEQIVTLARKLSSRKFCMVLNKMDPDSWQKIVSDLPGNVTLIESVPVDKIEQLFRESRIFVSTSLHEGFANTFLQAGKNSIPVISMGSDPNGMLSVHGAGLLPGDDQPQLAASVESLLNNAELHAKAAAAARNFVLHFHDRKVIAQQLFGLLRELKTMPLPH